MTLPVLPRELLDEIINQLTDKTTLKSCSLVCRSFRRSAQKMLFNSIAVCLANADIASSKTINFVRIVEQAPHLIEYILKLEISGNSRFDQLDLDDNSTEPLVNALAIFSGKGELFPINLRSLQLEWLWWYDIPSRLQDALVLLTIVPSLRDMTLYFIRGCPAPLVQDLPPLLKHLSLTETSFESLPTIRNELPKLESLKIDLYQFQDAMERTVDITQLKTFDARVNEHSRPLIEQILRPTSNSLKHLTLRFR